MKMKFVQITCNNHGIFALGEDGKVYAHAREYIELTGPGKHPIEHRETWYPLTDEIK